MEENNEIIENNTNTEKAESNPKSLEKEKIKELQKKEKERQKDIKKRQKEALLKFREEQNKEVEKDSENAKENRLKYLIQQSEIFAHFMSSNKPNSPVKQRGTPKKGKAAEKTRRNQTKEDEEDKELLENAIDESHQAGAIVIGSPSFIKNGQMRYYQIDGLNWLVQLYDHGINGVLADEMGLGKTLQTISLIGYLKHVRFVKGPHLVIVPKSTLTNWMNEFAKWCPTVKAIKFHGNKEERQLLKSKTLVAGEFEVCVTTYEMIIIEKSSFKKFNWRYLIIDEAHRIKNENSKLSEIVRDLNSNNRLLLTGTPLQNNLHELWALLNFLLPDVFSSADDFDNWFDLEKSKETVEKLHMILKPFLLRRLKSDVETELLPKKEIKLYVGLSKMQREWYKKVLLKDVDAVVSETPKEGVKKKGSKVRLMNIAMQLRKVCNHPYLFEGAEEGPPFENGEHIVKNCGKMILLDKILNRLKAKESRVLIFCQMTRQLDIIEDFLHLREYDYCRIDGSSSGEDRDVAISDFNKEGSSKFVFLLSTRAGGLGINLATADTVILYDSDWNPQVDLQAQDRAHRIGQKKQVLIYRFVTEGTIEEKIIEKAESKLYLDALVIQQGRFVEKQKGVNKEDLMKMITFGADHIFESGKDVEDLTENDIDEILAVGEKKTEELSEKLKANKLNLANFTLNDGENTTSLYNYGGVDYSKDKFKNVINKNKEQTQKQRNEKMEKEEMRKLTVFFSKKFGQLPAKFPRVYDFQFYPKKLYTLLEKEKNAWGVKRPILIDEAAEMEIAESRYKRDKTTENEELLEKVKEKYKKKLKEVKDLTKQEREEKKELLKKGFSNWNTKDFQSFIRVSSLYGRDNFKKLQDNLNKTEEEIKEYHTTFWKNYKDLKDWKKHLATIEEGENRNKRHLESLNSLQKFVSSAKDPLHLVYPGSSKKSSWTDKENLALAVLTDKHGYGNWEEIHKFLMEDPQFMFDWWVKSKTPSDLQKRADIILKTIHKYISEGEVEDDDDNDNSVSKESKPSTKSKRKSDQIEKKTSPKNDSKKKSKTKK